MQAAAELNVRRESLELFSYGTAKISGIWEGSAYIKSRINHIFSYNLVLLLLNSSIEQSSDIYLNQWHPNSEVNFEIC